MHKVVGKKKTLERLGLPGATAKMASAEREKIAVIPLPGSRAAKAPRHFLPVFYERRESGVMMSARNFGGNDIISQRAAAGGRRAAQSLCSFIRLMLSGNKVLVSSQIQALLTYDIFSYIYIYI